MAVVSVDAFMVLAGAVLTPYVGAVGLVQLLATDRVLPRVLTRTNQWCGTAHRIIVVYSLVVAMDGKMDGLAGVFALAFLVCSAPSRSAASCSSSRAARCRAPRSRYGLTARSVCSYLRSRTRRAWATLCSTSRRSSSWFS
ncbi:hypothetical protein PybrP1_012257 [[Pythium] brassicae (nom. inval.)]|nr:hypothetical protein PybrP1_012257 [[Pythium] brassicae (nom. inval.)]